MRKRWVILVLVIARTSFASDWLQWGGPNVDFTVEATGLAEKWPESGPKQLWKRGLGDGYSAILCKGDRLFTEYRDGDRYAVVALDAKTGTTIWEHRYTVKLWPEMEEGFGKGPNATPAILADRIISLSIDEQMRCLDLASGNVLWGHDLPTENGRRKRVEEYGYSNSPLVYKDTIIVPVGGTDHAVIAFEPKKDTVVWKSPPGGISYAPATITTLVGKEQYIYFEPEGIVSLDPTSGAVLWRSPIEFNNGNHLTPIVKCDDTHLWAGSQFPSGGGRLLEFPADGSASDPKQIWFDRKLRASHWTSIPIGDYIYGSIGDNSISFLAAFEWRTGKIAWRERGYHKAQCLYADGKLIFLDEEGKLVLARVSPSGLQVLASAMVTQSPSWTLPTLIGPTLYVRDRTNIMAFDLGRNAP